MISTMPLVACSECRQENEFERIYCHHCGARLEKKKAIRKTSRKPDDTQKRLQKLFDPQRARIRAFFFKFSKLLLGAFASGALTVMALPPELPPVAKELLAQPPSIGFDLERMLGKHEALQVNYTDEQTNSYLASSLKSKQKALDEPLLEFRRVVVAFREGAASVTMERAIFGAPIFTTIDFAPQSSGGKASVKPTGAHIGRMPVHPKLAKFMNYLFLDLWGALDRERKLAARLTSVEFHDKSVLFVSIP